MQIFFKCCFFIQNIKVVLIMLPQYAANKKTNPLQRDLLLIPQHKISLDSYFYSQLWFQKDIARLNTSKLISPAGGAVHPLQRILWTCSTFNQLILDANVHMFNPERKNYFNIKAASN